MQIPVLIEESPQGTFYAKAWDLVAEGKSIENPWLSIAGDLKNEPLVEEWLAAMKTYRQQVESDPNY
jgi:hypothetical protein